MDTLSNEKFCALTTRKVVGGCPEVLYVDFDGDGETDECFTSSLRTVFEMLDMLDSLGTFALYDEETESTPYRPYRLVLAVVHDNGAEEEI